MSKRSALFKKLKKEGYTILIPDMLPYHFRLVADVFTKHGYKTQMCTASGRVVKDEGLKSVHNDACYPALLTTGQFITELKSGKYDLNKTAVMMSQTGGGCRASNYIFLIRRALAKEFPQVPVLSLNLSGLEKDASLPLTPGLAYQTVLSILYGDMLMNLYNQVRPYETENGQAKGILNDCFERINSQLNKGQKGFYHIKKNYQFMIDSFSKIKIPANRKPRVGIVGEIYVKYSALANNDLAEFLVSENVEPFYPSFMEFLLYCLANNSNDYKLYRRNKFTHSFVKIGYNIALKMTRVQANMLKGTQFIPYDDFEETRKNCKLIISQGVKMGEGWLIPAEMVTMGLHGSKNIVCAQPFGCLPNHIAGKGMIRPIKNICPDLNIAAIDYDPGATKVNQENRIKLMLSNIQGRK